MEQKPPSGEKSADATRDASIQLDYHGPSFSQGRMDFSWEELSAEEQAQLYQDWEDGKGLIGGHPKYRPGHDRLPTFAHDRRFFRTLAMSDERAQNGVRLTQALREERPLEVEIGFGRGDFLLDRAARYPRRLFLGYEVKTGQALKALKRSEKQELNNLWISDDDARISLPELLPAGRATALHVLFPDPWWKEQHKIKRLFSPPFVDLAARVLRVGGYLHFKSDVEGYSELVRYLVGQHPAFSPNHPALAEQVEAHVPTHREQWCYDHDRPVWLSLFERV